ncbi:MAG: hypothetical protein IJ181_02935 [Acidaminococcaceae bacterium]|nr:hypothetical protein [Acidaminococcaceae bacterium]
MKKLFALVLSFCLLCGVAFAEGEPSADTGNSENKSSSLNLGSLPERKTVNSLTDVLTSQDADYIQKAISDSLVSYAEKDDALSVEAWSEKVLQEKMENASKARVTEVAQEIQDTIRETEEQNRSLAEAMKNGESKKSWLDGQLKKYITKAVELTGDAPKVTSSGRNSGFTIAGKNWKGQALSDREARRMRDDLEQDRDNGIKTAVAVGLVLAADSGRVSIMNQAAPRQLTMIAINAVEEAKTVLKVKKGIITGKEGVAKLTDTAMTSLIGMLAGFDYKQIGFLAGTAAGTAAGGAIEGATGGISLGSITINGALLGAYFGEKIGSRIGESLNATMDEKLKVRIITEFESFLGGTVATVLNIHDVQKALDSMEKESDIRLTEEAAKAVTKAKDGAVSLGSSISETVKSWGSSAGSTIKSWGTSAGSTMKNWGSSIAEFFGNAGQSIGKGWNGVVDKVKGKVSAAPVAQLLV